MALTHSDINLIRNIVREETDDIRMQVGGLCEEMDGVRKVVGGFRTEVGGFGKDVGDIREQVGGLREEVGSQRAEVVGLRAEVGDIREQVGSLTVKTTNLAVLQEESNHTLRGMAEMIRAALSQKKTVDAHGRRIGALEKQTVDLKLAISKRK